MLKILAATRWMGIEEELDIKIPDEAAENIATVGDAMEEIKKSLN